MKCLSSVACSQNECLPILGFDLYTFFNEFRLGGPTTSPLFRLSGPEQLNQLEEFFELKNIKVNIRSLAPDENNDQWWYLLEKTAVHEKGKVNINVQLSLFNVDRSGNENFPVDIFGGANENVGAGSLFNGPDFQCRVRGRLHRSPNFIGETFYRYRPSITLEAMHNKIKSYISHSNDIMFSLLLYVTDLHEEKFCCMVALYMRDVAAPLQPLLTHNISFGTRGPTAEEERLWNQGTGGAIIDGVGFGGPPCDAVNQSMYMIPLRLDYLLCTDCAGTEFNPHDGTPPSVDEVFNLNLYRIQNAFSVTLNDLSNS